MVVPEGMPVRKVGPLKQNFFFKFVSARSQGKSIRQAPGRQRQPLINDLHLANLHSDKVFAERSLLASQKEIKPLKERVRQLDSELHIARKDANDAYDMLDTLPEFLSERDYYTTQQNHIRDLSANVYKRIAERDLARRNESEALQKSLTDRAATTTNSAAIKSLSGRLSTALGHAQSLSDRVVGLQQTVKSQAGKVKGLEKELKDFSCRVGELEAQVDWGESRVTDLEAEISAAEASLASAEQALGDSEEGLQIAHGQLVDEQAKTAPKRGRPAGHRGADQLAENWDNYTSNGRKLAFWRHCEDMKSALQQAGIDNWLPSALAHVLDNLPTSDGASWVDVLFESRPFAKRKCELIKDLQNILHGEWNLDLAEHALIEIGLSHSMYQGLRNAFSKSIYKPINTTCDDARAGMYSKRPWYTCEATGTIFHLPEPLPPRYKLEAHMKEALEPLGLKLSVDGKISERSFLDTLRATFRRDAEHLKVFDVARPAHPCFGIDHATISGARDFTQGGITMGGCYKKGALLSEQKHVTLCIGLHHDDGKGLSAMLGPKEASESAGEQRGAVVGIAEEFRQLSDGGVLDMGGGEAIPCEPVVCLDFAAFRGITRKRGKCSAVCACRGLASLQSYPGANGIPDLPEGDSIADFRAAQAIAQSQCGYGQTIMELPSLLAATHRLPKGWDFERDGPWSCSWCQKVIYTAPGQQLAMEVRLAALRARVAAGKSDSADCKAAKKELDALLKEHAEEHGDALLLEKLIMTNQSGTKPFIIDPMHALELNLMKTLWKYSFGDRMTDDDRELVAEYLSSIGLHLDIRAKGKRDPQSKWFSAAQADEFVLGSSHFKHSKSPGLVSNVLAIVEIIFDKGMVAVADELEAAAPPPKKKATARKDRHTGGAALGAAEVAAAEAAGLDPAGSGSVSLGELRGEKDVTPLQSTEIRNYIRKRYGNHSAVVLKILNAWEAYGELFYEWRAEWTGDSDEYRAKRALQLARCARDFQRALTSLSNYKQKSWYTHVLVWIAWQNLFLYGNAWPLSTISIESRNARIKRYGRRFTNWRPLVDGSTAYAYQDRRSKEYKTSERRYNSSAVHQLLKRVALSELGWHRNNKFTAPDKLRLQTQLRSTRIKIEVADAPPSLRPVTMLSELSQKI